MAENRGGMRPTAPQNNPANISATGGDGQGGNPTQAARYIPGMPYGQGGATYDQQTAAPMAGSAEPKMPSLPPMLSLDDPTERPDEELSAGINSGPGPGSEVMRNLPNRAPSLIDTIRHLAQFDPSGDAELIYRNLLDQG